MLKWETTLYKKSRVKHWASSFLRIMSRNAADFAIRKETYQLSVLFLALSPKFVSSIQFYSTALLFDVLGDGGEYFALQRQLCHCGEAGLAKTIGDYVPELAVTVIGLSVCLRFD